MKKKRPRLRRATAKKKIIISLAWQRICIVTGAIGRAPQQCKLLPRSDGTTKTFWTWLGTRRLLAAPSAYQLYILPFNSLTSPFVAPCFGPVFLTYFRFSVSWKPSSLSRFYLMQYVVLGVEKCPALDRTRSTGGIGSKQQTKLAVLVRAA